MLHNNVVYASAGLQFSVWPYLISFSWKRGQMLFIQIHSRRKSVPHVVGQTMYDIICSAISLLQEEANKVALPQIMVRYHRISNLTMSHFFCTESCDYKITTRKKLIYLWSGSRRACRKKPVTACLCCVVFWFLLQVSFTNLLIVLFV